jgi:hypothetical protein
MPHTPCCSSREISVRCPLGSQVAAKLKRALRAAAALPNHAAARAPERRCAASLPRRARSRRGVSGDLIRCQSSAACMRSRLALCRLRLLGRARRRARRAHAGGPRGGHPFASRPLVSEALSGDAGVAPARRLRRSHGRKTPAGECGCCALRRGCRGRRRCVARGVRFGPRRVLVVAPFLCSDTGFRTPRFCEWTQRLLARACWSCGR